MQRESTGEEDAPRTSSIFSAATINETTGQKYRRILFNIFVGQLIAVGIVSGGIFT